MIISKSTGPRMVYICYQVQKQSTLLLTAASITTCSIRSTPKLVFIRLPLFIRMSPMLRIGSFFNLDHETVTLCTTDKIVISPTSERLRKFIRKQEVQNAHHHIILYASPHHTFPCDGTPTLFRKVVTFFSQQESDSSIITFQTQNKTFYHEVFMHANVSYESNMYNQTHKRAVHPPSAVQQQQPQQHHRNVKPLGFWGTVTNFITQTYEEVKTVATVTTQVMDMAATVVVGIVTGELDMDR
eukprot:PhF_6_TR37870/c0_g1_i5/m.56469